MILQQQGAQKWGDPKTLVHGPESVSGRRTGAQCFLVTPKSVTGFN